MSAPTVDLCHKGLHPMTAENTTMVKRPGGKHTRRCRVCDRERNRRYREAHRPRINAEARARVSRELAAKLPVWEQALPKRPTGTDVLPGWEAGAACDDAHIDGFFPADDESISQPTTRHLAHAYRFCGGCPLVEMCDQVATGRRDVGLWGGKWRYVNTVTNDYRVIDLLHEEYPA